MSTVIVAGYVHVDPADRDRFIEGHRNIVEAGRTRPNSGCLDVSISADSVDPGRVNIFEYWESAEALEAFRASAPTPTVSIALTNENVLKHQITASGPPFA
ncbi:putative quinol monooxygenase [Pseudonocardia spinosispora]|uniref:putative quinol monooxygenase n=1 Tax=Pseudonocardia spinosispora TaxID=103441 RepID=UPI0004920FF8|nr:antibiotic biosynthesis monooxygenase family protein [Pseudonocardia spinosispora]